MEVAESHAQHQRAGRKILDCGQKGAVQLKTGANIMQQELRRSGRPSG